LFCPPLSFAHPNLDFAALASPSLVAERRPQLDPAVPASHRSDLSVPTELSVFDPQIPINKHYVHY